MVMKKLSKIFLIIDYVSIMLSMVGSLTSFFIMEKFVIIDTLAVELAELDEATLAVLEPLLVFVNVHEVIGIVLAIFNMIAATIVFILVLNSLTNSKKQIALGVLSIIFVSVPAGIFYLIWNGDNQNEKETP